MIFSENQKKSIISDWYLSKSSNSSNRFVNGAGEGTWTPTDEPLDPKSSASANFATPGLLINDIANNFKKQGFII